MVVPKGAGSKTSIVLSEHFFIPYFCVIVFIRVFVRVPDNVYIGEHISIIEKFYVTVGKGCVGHADGQ